MSFVLFVLKALATLRIDPQQRFSCSQCGRCCRRFDVIVSAAEIELYKRRGAEQWLSGTVGDPFEPVPTMPALQRIRKRDDGACVFLSSDNRCRIHQELGGAKKPLTCRVFPYSFHRAPDGVVVTASFGCPTIVANQGAPIASGASRTALESLGNEWLDAKPSTARARELIAGRSIDARTTRILRENLLVMLKRDSTDIRQNIARIAHALDDLTRSRVVSLGEQEFAEYVSLTLPYSASQEQAPSIRRPGAIGRLLQHGFLYVVCATREAIERRDRSAAGLRIARLLMLAHFHGIGPSIGRVNLKALKRRPVDINAPEIRPIVFHYLRSTLETLGAHERTIIDELAIAASLLNTACALASMNADALGRDVDRGIFIEAMTDASDLSHTPDTGILGRVLTRLSSGTDAIWKLAN